MCKSEQATAPIKSDLRGSTLMFKSWPKPREPTNQQDQIQQHTKDEMVGLFYNDELGGIEIEPCWRIYEAKSRLGKDSQQ